jgi:hypothetical protein
MKIYHPAGPEGDTGAAQTGVIRRIRMSEEERARLMAEGRCFECGEKGQTETVQVNLKPLKGITPEIELPRNFFKGELWARTYH